MTGGGVQTPGFMGHGKHFISSKKFMKAEGGIERIVWMPKDLKEQVAERLKETAKELYGIDNFCDMVGDETIATDPVDTAGIPYRKRTSGTWNGSDDVRNQIRIANLPDVLCTDGEASVRKTGSLAIKMRSIFRAYLMNPYTE